MKIFDVSSFLFLLFLGIVVSSLTDHKALDNLDVVVNNQSKLLIRPQILSVSLQSVQGNSSTSLSIDIIKSIKFRIHAFKQTFTLDLYQHTEGMVGGAITRQLQCHFTGTVNGHHDSGAHFNLCDGMHGIFYWNRREYIIEPTTISKSYPGFSSSGSILLPHHIFSNRVTSKPIFFCKVLEAIKPSENIPKESVAPQKILPRIKRSTYFEDEESEYLAIDHDVIHDNIIELLIVVTSNLVKKFGKDLNEYILNNVAIATKMLRDPSIKTSLAINVVDIIALDKDYERLNNLNNWSLLTQDAVVDRFCHWIQYKKRYSKYVWDTAILINDGSFSTYAIGITHLRSMCSNNNCIAVVDRGFGTGFIIAHEIGHQMNAPHDYDNIAACKNFEPKGQDNDYSTIMSTSLYFDHYPFKWSRCSEYLINGFLRSEDSWCLKQHNKHKVLYIHDYIYDYHKNFSAGLRYDLNTQCSLAFGEQGEHCNSPEHIKTCKSLYCIPKRVGLCMRSHSVVGDGTPCDTDKRCVHGKCINVEIKVSPVDGDWSDFAEWSNCSRPCNGGIQYSERFCNNPTPSLGGRYCVGTRVQIRSCNIHNCETELNTREEMCRKLNAKPYVPRIDEEAVCKLVCIKDNKAVNHNQELTDGTPCYAHRTDICVRSKCYKTGCDRVIASDKVYDNCHVCGGKNDTCTRVKKFFDGSKISSSRSMLVAFKLPKNITNVSLRKVSERYYPYSEEVYDDYQILLLIDHNTMIRRGESLEPFAGGELYYSGSNKREETYRITGLIEKEIVVLIRAENPYTALQIPSVEYHYYIPNEMAPTITDMFSWTYPKFNSSACFGKCNGKIHLESICVRNADKVAVSEAYCRHSVRPIIKVRDCKSRCGYKWQKPSKHFISLFIKGACPVRCGNAHMFVYFPCLMKMSLTRSKLGWKSINEAQCFTAGLTDRPYKVVPCLGECHALLWSYGPWTNCTAGCGASVRYRTSTCKDVMGRSWNPEQCLKDLGDAEEKEACTAVSTCKDQTHWVYGSWSACSKSCGSGIETRNVECVKKDGLSSMVDVSGDQMMLKAERVPRTLCLSYSDEPITARSCVITSCYKWTLDDGGKCSVTCGIGSRVYGHVCSRIGKSRIAVDDSQCMENGMEKPPLETKPCDMRLCYKPKWLKLPWGKCSESCGKGMRLRSVRCGYTTMDNETVLLRTDVSCRNESRPAVMEQCQDIPCSSWKYGAWSECQGICMYGIQYRSVDCVDKDTGKILQASSCSGIVETDLRRCLLTSLCGYWKIGEWSKCSVTCGFGTKIRKVECHFINGTQSPDKSICLSAVPFDEVHCENPICKSKAFWWLLKSSQCYSYGCNPGVLYSDIRCVNEEFEVLRDSACNEKKHPNYYVGCLKAECKQYFWKAIPWLDIPCSSSTCMMTIRNRMVNCVDDYGNIYGNVNCDEATKLDDWRLCSSPRNCSDVPRSCKELKKRHPESEDGEYSLAIDLNWTYFIYCADMKMENPKEYLTLKRPNYSRSSKFVSVAENGTCTYPEEYEDHYLCPGCTIDDRLRSITYYNKIRVNMTDLSIDILDTRYSTTIGTSAIPYGTAKDCAGSKTCPQGHFMIDLSGTEFSVSMKTSWNEIYNNYGYRIIRTKGSQIVKGWCGGKCSGCAPLPNLYIEPQMYGRDLEVKSYK